MKRNSQRKETEINGIFSGTYSNSHDNLIASPKNENIIALLPPPQLLPFDFLPKLVLQSQTTLFCCAMTTHSMLLVDMLMFLPMLQGFLLPLTSSNSKKSSTVSTTRLDFISLKSRVIHPRVASQSAVAVNIPMNLQGGVSFEGTTIGKKDINHVVRRGVLETMTGELTIRTTDAILHGALSHYEPLRFGLSSLVSDLSSEIFADKSEKRKSASRKEAQEVLRSHLLTTAARVVIPVLTRSLLHSTPATFVHESIEDVVNLIHLNVNHFTQ